MLNPYSNSNCYMRQNKHTETDYEDEHSRVLTVRKSLPPIHTSCIYGYRAQNSNSFQQSSVFKRIHISLPTVKIEKMTCRNSEIHRDIANQSTAKAVGDGNVPASGNILALSSVDKQFSHPAIVARFKKNYTTARRTVTVRSVSVKANNENERKRGNIYNSEPAVFIKKHTISRILKLAFRNM